MSKGIDYSMGTTNIDTKTGIRFGVIPVNEVLQAWYDSAESDYGPATCPKCGNEAQESSEVSSWDSEEDQLAADDDYWCNDCKQSFGSDDAYGDDPICYTLDDGEYLATEDSYGDIFIERSPYFTRAQFCSPCAPGACHLSNPCENGEKAYCFGHDWFENSVAPYPVYSVATGERIPPTS